MVDVVITELHRLSDRGAWAGDDLNVETAGFSDRVSQAATYERSVTDGGGTSDGAYTEDAGTAIIVAVTDQAGSTDSGAWADDGVAESAGSTDSLGDPWLPITRTVSEPNQHGDEGGPLTWAYYVTLSDEAAGLDDTLAEPDSTAPLDFTRTVSEPNQHGDVTFVSGDQSASVPDDAGSVDEVSYRLRTRVDTPPERTFVIQPEVRVLLVPAPRRRFPS